MSARLQTTRVWLGLLIALTCAGCASGGAHTTAGADLAAPVASQSGHLQAAALDSFLVARVRSARAAQLLSGAGFTDVRNLEGGMVAYRAAEH